MMTRILIIGGYGNFGRFIARALAQEDNVQLILAGRSAQKAQILAKSLQAEWAVIDATHDVEIKLTRIRPDLVIQTCGPFQGQGYRIAESCIRQKCHYLDLADGRDFVSRISSLDAAARAAGVLVISGASSVPCLTSAVIDHYIGRFKTLHDIHYGIATAQKTRRGLATAQAVLSYAGKPFTTLIKGHMQEVYGWQDLHRHPFPELGNRFLGNCDVPDLDLFPQRYPDLKTIRFYAGLGLSSVHLSLWILTGLVRIGLIRDLQPAAPLFLALSRPFDLFGTDQSGFYMTLSGIDAAGQDKCLTFNLYAGSGDGALIPCIPIILLAQKHARGEIGQIGACPCLGFITLEEYLAALNGLDVRWSDTEIDPS